MTEKTMNGNQHERPMVAPPLLCSYRLTITLMSLVASFGAILMTINLGMAIVCMNNKNLPNNSDLIHDNCSDAEAETVTSPTCIYPADQDAVYWDKESQGLLLGAVYYGVVGVQMLVGWLSDKYGKTKIQLILGQTVMGIVSVLSPILIQRAGVPYYFAARVVQGAAMCFGISSVLPLLNRWMTPNEQGLLVGLSFAGVGLANSLTYPISAFLCEYAGWKSIFYFAGACGLLWGFAAVFLIYDSPALHPRISVEEKEYLLSHHNNKSRAKEKTKVAIPWKQILLSIPVWSVITTNFFFFAAQKGTVINLPLYMKDVLDFNVTENGIFSALPSVLSLIIHLTVGPIFDCVRAKSTFSSTTVRKIFHAIGTIIPASLMFAASQLDPEQKYVIVVLIAIGYSFYEVAWIGGYAFSLLDMAPDYVGVLQGINNTIGLAPGFIMPVVISAMTPNGSVKEWSHVFILFGSLYSLAALIYLVTGSSSLQSWGKVKNAQEEQQEEKLVDRLS